MKKILVAFYSRTGTTKKAAEQIAKLLRADIEEIIDTRNRKGIWGWLTAGRDAARKRLTELKKIKKNPANYELVVVGTPIWSFTVSAPTRTYLTQNKFKRLAFFCTMGGSGAERAFSEMEAVSKKPVAVLALRQRDVDSGSAVQKIRDFAKLLR